MNKVIINLRKILIIVFAAGLAAAVYLRSVTNYEKSGFLMDTYVTVKTEGFNAKAAAEEAYERLAEIARKTDCHNENSALCRGEYDSDLKEVISLGKRYEQLSGGLFDIEIRPLTRLWDITGENPHVPSDGEIKKVLETMKTSETEFDLGGIAKGFAADKAKEVLDNYKIKNAVINLGGNVYAAGKKKIGIQNPFAENGSYMGIVTVENMSVVTAGSYQRYFEQDGIIYHHILNPKTGYPAKTDLKSATVIAKSSADADAASTIIFMLGSEKGADFAENNGFACIMLDDKNKVHCVGDIDFEITDDNFERAD